MVQRIQITITPEITATITSFIEAFKNTNIDGSENNTKAIELFKILVQSNPDCIREILLNLPYNLLYKVKELCKNHTVGHIITEDILNHSMKKSEMVARRKRLPKETNQESNPLLKEMEDSIAFIPVFQEDGSFDESFRSRALTEEELSHPSIIANFPQYNTVSTLEQFKRNFEMYSKLPGLSDLLGSNILVMGGSVLACLQRLPRDIEDIYFHYNFLEFPNLPLPPELKLHIASYLTDEKKRIEKQLDKALKKHYWQKTNNFASGDIDIFVSSFDHSTHNPEPIQEDLLEQTSELVDTVALQLLELVDNSNKYLYVKSQAAISFCAAGKRRNLQVINCGDRTPEDALIDFDIDCVTFAYDGEQVYTLPRGRRAFSTRCNFMDPFVLRFKRTRNRVAKYFKRGYSALLYENCSHQPRCDVKLDANVSLLWQRTLAAIEYHTDYVGGVDNYKKSNQDFDEEQKFDEEIPKATSGPSVGMEMNLDADDYFYRGEVLSTFADNIHEIENRLLLFETFKQMREKTYNLPISPATFVYDENLEKLLDTPVPIQRKRIFVGKDPLRIGHVCYSCGDITDGEFKDLICSNCTTRNEKWISATCHLDKHVALVTGIRSELGFEVALRLLKDGAIVVGLTRFPLLTKKKFSQSPGFESWKIRLHLFEVDLRKINELSTFLNQFKTKFKRLDIIINAANHPVSKSKEYYEYLSNEETKLKSGSCISNDNYSDVLEKEGYIDHRDKTPYNSLLGEISSTDMMETQLVNTIAPCTIITSLQSMLEQNRFTKKYIINVTSRDGIFCDKGFTRRGHHAPLDISKAGLNMLTFTLGNRFSKESNTYIYAVDPGWFYDVRPKHYPPVQLPLTVADAAARVLHPIYEAKFSPDYKYALCQNYEAVQWC